jgi:hypothetical protein
MVIPESAVKAFWLFVLKVNIRIFREHLSAEPADGVFRDQDMLSPAQF